MNKESSSSSSACIKNMDSSCSSNGSISNVDIIDKPGPPKKRRIAFTNSQLDHLEKSFYHNKYPSSLTVGDMSHLLDIKEEKVKVLFKNFYYFFGPCIGINIIIK